MQSAHAIPLPEGPSPLMPPSGIDVLFDPHSYPYRHVILKAGSFNLNLLIQSNCVCPIFTFFGIFFKDKSWRKVKPHVRIKCMILALLAQLSNLLSTKTIFKSNTNTLSLYAPAPIEEVKIVLMCFKTESKGRKP